MIRYEIDYWRFVINVTNLFDKYYVTSISIAVFGNRVGAPGLFFEELAKTNAAKVTEPMDQSKSDPKLLQAIVRAHAWLNGSHVWALSFNRSFCQRGQTSSQDYPPADSARVPDTVNH